MGGNGPGLAGSRRQEPPTGPVVGGRPARTVTTMPPRHRQHGRPGHPGYSRQLGHMVRGFTLVEIIITLAVLGVLAALGIFGATSFLKTGYDTDARSRLMQVAQLEQSLANTWGTYSQYPQDFTQVSDDTTVTEQTSQQAQQVSASVGSLGDVGLAVRSRSGRCLYLLLAPLTAGADTRDVTAAVPTSAPCHGREALADGEEPQAGAGGGVSVKTS